MKGFFQICFLYSGADVHDRGRYCFPAGVRHAGNIDSQPGPGIVRTKISGLADAPRHRKLCADHTYAMAVDGRECGLLYFRSPIHPAGAL